MAQWAPIDSAAEIRLLTIRAAEKRDAPLEVDLSIRQKGSSSPYEALSYTWGSPDRKECIRCNDQELLVTRNCAKALRALRERQHLLARREENDGITMPIWIDAICINQSDLRERGLQVARMAEIFGSATRTIIYIGDPDNHWRFLVDNVLHVFKNKDFATSMDQINGRYDAERARRQYLSELGWEAEDLFRIMDKSRFRQKREPSASSPSQPPVIYEQNVKEHWNAFFGRPWFHRVWIVQEVMSSEELVFLLGHDEVPWSDLEQSSMAAELLQRTQPIPASDTTPPTYDVPSVVSMRRAWGCIWRSRPQPWKLWGKFGRPHVVGIEDLQADEEEAFDMHDLPDSSQRTRGLSFSSLIEILQVVKYFECQDSKDRLFAIVSLFGESMPDDLMPDYTKTIEDVYTDIAWFLLRQGERQALVFEPLYKRRSGSTRDVPSWVIDWENDETIDRQRALRYKYDWYGLSVKTQERMQREIEQHNEAFLAYEQMHKDMGLHVKRHGRSLYIRGLVADDIPASEEGRNRFDVRTARDRRVRGLYDLKPDDTICVLLGFAEPFVLRPAANDAWHLVGACEVDGLMLGEAVSDADWATAQAEKAIDPWQDFEIV